MPIALPSYATSMNLEFDGANENVIVLYAGDGSLSDPDVVLRWDNLSESGKQEILNAFASTGGSTLNASGAFTDAPANPSFSFDFGTSTFDPATTLLKDVLPGSYLTVAPAIAIAFNVDLADGTEATGLVNDATSFDISIEVVDSDLAQVYSSGPVSSTGDSLQTWADVIALIKTAEASFVEDYSTDTLTSGEISGLVAGETYTVNLTGTLVSSLGLTGSVVGGQNSGSVLTLNVSYASTEYTISSNISATDTLNTFLESIDASFTASNPTASSVSVALTDITVASPEHDVVLSGNLVRELQRNITDGVITTAIPTFATTGLEALKLYRTATGSFAYAKYEKFLSVVADEPTDAQYRTSVARSGLKAYYDRNDTNSVIVELDGVVIGTVAIV